MSIQNKPWEKLKPGETWRGWWEVGVSDLPAIPVLAARGKAGGTNLLVTGGVHGDEYEGPAAIHALFNDLDVARLCGVWIGLPIVNSAAWQARARRTPVDNGDLNRAFPGALTGASHPTTAALAQAVFETFVRPCDVLVDLHSGGAALVHLPMVGWYVGGETAEKLARGFGGGLHPWIVPDAAGVLSYEAHRASKVALGAEWGGGARLDPEGVKAYTLGLRRVMAALNMPPSERAGPSVFDARAPISGGYQETQTSGLFASSIRLGERVAAGTTLGVLYDAFGSALEEIKAKRPGIVAALPHIALLRAGERVAYIG
jgi:predicted deacylase